MRRVIANDEVPKQAMRSPASHALPEGLRYEPDLVDSGEESQLIAEFRDLDFSPFKFHGFTGRRRVVYYGWRYDYDGGGLTRADPIPSFLLPTRAMVAGFAGHDASALEQALITEYAPGATIGWHRDRPVFGDVVGISLNTACTFRLRRRVKETWERRAFIAEPRSAYLLSGAARHEWEHSIPAVAALRYSITFRTLRRRPLRQ
jgi:alkylated DNA repair dioxygenase AlkB